MDASRGDEVIQTGLPDLSGMTLAQLLASDDPVLRAAMARVVDQVRSRAPVVCSCDDPASEDPS